MILAWTVKIAMEMCFLLAGVCLGMWENWRRWTWRQWIGYLGLFWGGCALLELWRKLS